jgi:hypothetical protein
MREKSKTEDEWEVKNRNEWEVKNQVWVGRKWMGHNRESKYQNGRQKDGKDKYGA